MANLLRRCTLSERNHVTSLVNPRCIKTRRKLFTSLESSPVRGIHLNTKSTSRYYVLPARVRWGQALAVLSVPADECPAVWRPPWGRSWLRSYSSVPIEPSHWVWMRRCGWYQHQPPEMSFQVPIFTRCNVSNVFFNKFRVLSISSVDCKESDNRRFHLKNMLLRMSTVRNYERRKKRTSCAVNQRTNIRNG